MTDNSASQARAQFDSIREMVEALQRARDIEARTFDWEAEAERLGYASDDDGAWTHGEREDDTHDDAETACRSTERYDGELYPDEDGARQRIEEDALSVEVRSGWYTPGARDADTKPAEYRILLCTGGPAVQIIGELSEHGEPESARLQHQDWFQPWTDWTGPDLPDDASDVLLEYARVFYFGEG